MRDAFKTNGSSPPKKYRLRAGDLSISILGRECRPFTRARLATEGAVVELRSYPWFENGKPRVFVARTEKPDRVQAVPVEALEPRRASRQVMRPFRVTTVYRFLGRTRWHTTAHRTEAQARAKAAFPCCERHRNECATVIWDGDHNPFRNPKVGKVRWSGYDFEPRPAPVSATPTREVPPAWLRRVFADFGDGGAR